MSEVVVVREPAETVTVIESGSDTVTIETVTTESVVEIGIAGPQGTGDGEGGAAWSRFHVRNFGAELDGETVDTQAFQDAIDAAREAGGGIVEFDGPTVWDDMLTILTGVDGVRTMNISIRGTGMETCVARWADDTAPAIAMIRVLPDGATGQDSGDGGTGANFGGELTGFALDGNWIARKGIWATNQSGMRIDVGYKNFAAGEPRDACLYMDGGPGCLLNEIRGHFGMGSVNLNWGLYLKGHRNRICAEFGGTAKGSVFIASNGSGNVIESGTDFEGLTVDGTVSLHIESWYTVTQPGVSFEDVNDAIPNARSIYVAPNVRHVNIDGPILGFQDLAEAAHAIELAGGNRDIQIHSEIWNTHCAGADVKVGPDCDVLVWGSPDRTMDIDPTSTVRTFTTEAVV